MKMLILNREKHFQNDSIENNPGNGQFLMVQKYPSKC